MHAKITSSFLAATLPQSKLDHKCNQGIRIEGQVWLVSSQASAPARIWLGQKGRLMLSMHPCACINLHICVHVIVCMCTLTHLRVCVCAHVHANKSMCTRIQTSDHFVCACVHVSVCIDGGGFGDEGRHTCINAC